VIEAKVSQGLNGIQSSTQDFIKSESIHTACPYKPDLHADLAVEVGLGSAQIR
jgi:hypothetical protein